MQQSSVRDEIRPTRHGWLMRQTARLVLAAFVAGPASAGEQTSIGTVDVVAGQGAVTVNQDTQTTLSSEGRVIYEWDRIQQPADHTLEFDQSGANASALNRGVGQSAFEFFGTVKSNGTVIFANEAGVYFQDGSSIQVDNLIAAAGRLNDGEFLADQLRFTDLKGPVENRGTIRGLEVALLGARVANHGDIFVEDGQLLMLAGDEVLIRKHDSPIVIRVPLESGADDDGTRSGSSADDPAVENTGHIDAGRLGRVRLAAADGLAYAIRNRTVERIAQASRKQAPESGVIRAGTIELQGGEGSAVVVGGRLDATGSAKHATGGDIDVFGERILVSADAVLDASGEDGGGRIRVGGDRQGQGDAPRAALVVVDETAELHADATDSGDGGEVIVWSDGHAYVHGEVTARGGERRGDGGFVETSGRVFLDLTHSASVASRSGRSSDRAGEWLIDPYDILIKDFGADGCEGLDNCLDDSVDLDDPFFVATPILYASGQPSRLDTGVLETALSEGSNITVTTSTGTETPGDGRGDIRVQSEIRPGVDAAENTAVTLTLRAANHIFVEADIRPADVQPGQESDNLNLGLQLIANDNFTQFEAADTPDSIPNRFVGDVQIAEGVRIGSNRGDVLMQGVNVFVNEGASIVTDGGDVILAAVGGVNRDGTSQGGGSAFIRGDIDTGNSLLDEQGEALEGGTLRVQARFGDVLQAGAPPQSVDTIGGDIELSGDIDLGRHAGGTALTVESLGGNIDVSGDVKTGGGGIRLVAVRVQDNLPPEEVPADVGGEITIASSTTLDTDGGDVGIEALGSFGGTTRSTDFRTKVTLAGVIDTTLEPGDDDADSDGLVDSIGGDVEIRAEGRDSSDPSGQITIAADPGVPGSAPRIVTGGGNVVVNFDADGNGDGAPDGRALANIVVAGSIDAGLAPGAQLDVGLEDALFGRVFIDAAGTLSVENRAADGSPVTIRGEVVALRSANQSSIVGSRRADLVFVSNDAFSGSGEGPAIHADDIEIRAGADSFLDLVESQSRVVLGDVALRDTDGGADINSLTFAQNATITAADIPDPDRHFDQTVPGATLDGLLYLIHSMNGSVELDDPGAPALLTGSGLEPGPVLEIIANDVITLGNTPGAWSGVDLQSLDLSLNGGFSVDTALADAVSDATDDLTITSGRLQAGDSGLVIEEGVTLDALENLLLHAAASGGQGDLTFGPAEATGIPGTVTLRSRQLALWAGVGEGAARGLSTTNRVIAGSESNALVRFDVVGGAAPGDRSFSLRQEAGIGDSDVPEISQFSDTGQIGLMDYELRSDSGDIDLGPEAAAKLARTDLRLLAWGNLLLNQSLDVGETAATFEVRSLDLGRTRAFEVTQALLDTFAFVAPSGLPADTDAALTLRSGVTEAGNLTFEAGSGVTVTVTANELRLVAGDGTGGNGEGTGSAASGNASQIVVGDNVRFNGWTPGGGNPPLALDSFVFHQDADIQVVLNADGVTSPLPDLDVSFLGGAPGTYALRSDDGSIQLILDLFDDTGLPIPNLARRLPLASDMTILSADTVTVSRLDGQDLVLDEVFADGAPQRLEVRSFDALFGALDVALSEEQADGTPVPRPPAGSLAEIITTAAGTRGLWVYGFDSMALADRTGDPVPEPVDLSYRTTGGPDDDVSIPVDLGFEQDATFVSAELLDLGRIGSGCGLGAGASCEPSRLRTHYALTNHHGDIHVSPEKIYGGNVRLELKQELQDDTSNPDGRVIVFDSEPGPGANRTFFVESFDASSPFAWNIDADTTLQAAESIVLSAGTSGMGDLGFATGVVLQSEDILLEAYGPAPADTDPSLLPIVDARTNAPTFNFIQPDATTPNRVDSPNDRFSIVQDGTINDNDVDRPGSPERRTLPDRAAQFVFDALVNDTLFAYTLQSQRRGIDIPDLREVGANRLLLLANAAESYDDDPDTVDRPGRITIRGTAANPDVDFAGAGIDRAALIADEIQLIAGPTGSVMVNASNPTTPQSIFFSDVGGAESPALSFLVEQDQSFTDLQNALNLPSFFQFASGITGVEYTLRLSGPGDLEIGRETAAKLRGTALTLEAHDDVKIDVPITLLEGLVLTSLDVKQAGWVAPGTDLTIAIGDVLVPDVPPALPPDDPLDESLTATQIETVGDQTYAGDVIVTGNVNFLGEDITFEGDVDNALTGPSDVSSLDFLTRGTVSFAGEVGCDGGVDCEVGADDWSTQSLADRANRWFDRIRVLFDADAEGPEAVAFVGSGPQQLFARVVEIFAIAPSQNETTPLVSVVEVTQIPLAASLYKTDPDYSGPGTGDPNAGLEIFTESLFRMGTGQKGAVQGDLTIESRDTIAVSDLSALLIVLDVSDTGGIEVLRRAAAPYLTPDGRELSDAGTSFVANSIDFAGTTTYTGKGRNPSFAIEDPNSPPDSIARFTLTAIDRQGSALDKGDFEWTFSDPPTALPALHASGPPRNDISQIFEGLENKPGPSPWLPDEWRVADPRRLRELSVMPRERTAAEWQRHLANAGVIDDIGRGSPRADGLVTVAQARLLAGDAQKAIDIYQRIFGDDGVRTPRVRAVLADALEQYRRSSGTRKVVGFEFRRYVKNRPSSLFEAYQVFEDLDTLFDHHRALGLTRGEYRPIQAAWLADVAPEGITVDELLEAVHPSRYVRGTDILDIFGD